MENFEIFAYNCILQNIPIDMFKGRNILRVTNPMGLLITK